MTTDKSFLLCRMHTHPSKCLPRSKDCAIDCPSDSDMDLIMHDGVRGNFSHFVFCHTGTYLVALQPQLRAELYEHKVHNTLKKASKQICKAFKQLQNKFEKQLQGGEGDLETYRGRWLDHHCLILDTTGVQNSIEDMLAVWKADADLPDFKVGNQAYWQVSPRVQSNCVAYISSALTLAVLAVSSHVLRPRR